MIFGSCHFLYHQFTQRAGPDSPEIHFQDNTNTLWGAGCTFSRFRRFTVIKKYEFL